MLVIKRRSVLIITALLVTAIAFLVCFGALSTTTNALIKRIVVVLDAGHGGVDGGVIGVSTGVKESELNLSITKKVQKHLVDAGIEVVLTRSTDAGLYGLATNKLKKKDMKKRKEIIEKVKPSLVVSIHMNKYSLSSRRGGQVFYREDILESKILANCLQNEFNEVYKDVKPYSPLKGDYYILNCTNYPSVIAECGFLSSHKDEALLITEEHREAVAYSIFKGIINYLAETTDNFTN